jgi:hypothetical protein
MKFCSSLQQLIIDVPSISDDDLWLISSSCKGIKYLSLVSGSNSVGILTDESLLNISKNCISLKHLLLKSYQINAFTDRGLDAISEASFSLQTFGFEYIPTLSTPASLSTYKPDNNLLQNALIKIIKRSDSMSSLILDWPCDINYVIKEVSAKLNTLKTFKIGNILQSVQVQNLIKANPKLKQLQFNEVDDGVLQLIFHDICIQDSLTILEYTGVCAFKDFIDAAARCSNLISLKFIPSNRVAYLTGINDSNDDIEALASNCQKIESIHIPVYSDVALISLSTHLSKLTSLTIIGGTGITNQGLVLLVSKCRMITHLNLGKSPKITDTGIEFIAKNLSLSIRVLSLPSSASTGLTDRSLIAISSSCKQLQEWHNVTGNIYKFLTYLPMLPRLQIFSSIVGLSSAEQFRLKAACKKLILVI